MLDPRDESQRPAPGIANIDHMRRGLATKASKPCKTLMYLVVHPSLVHIITLKCTRTLHKRRPCTHVRMHLRTLTRITVVPRALTCADVCAAHASTCNHALLEQELSEPPTGVGLRPGAREGGGLRGGHRALHARREACEGGKGERNGQAMAGPAPLVEVVLAAPTPRTGGGDRPPLWVQRRAWLSSGAHGRAGETGGAHRACGSIALRPRSRPNPFPNPPGPIPFQKAGNVHVVPAAASST
mgnify:CR=1 FL=1